MQKINFFVLSGISLLALSSGCSEKKEQTGKMPNILLILADDLGYGDVGCYNPESTIPTPNLDHLAGEGIRFLDAHSPATVCTPSRYSILTGRMAFRTGFPGVFTGAGGPCLIEKGRLTLPQMLRNQGYSTAMVGKWHVGLTFLDKEGKPICRNGLEAVKEIDYSRPIPDAPIHRGFDYFFGTACCPGTDWLYAYIDGDLIPVPPTHILDRSKLPNHPYSHDNRPGLQAPDYDLTRLDMVFLQKSIDFIKNHEKTEPDKPFFLYHCTSAVHLPSFAAKEFLGQTNAGPHGDYIFELDYIVGRLMKTLDSLGIADNTLVIFSSDNGPETSTVVHMRQDYNHDGARPWRGMKRDQWEGGHRVPMIVRWPAMIKAGSTSNQMISLTDIMATCADITNAELPAEAAEDSYDMLPVFLNEQSESIRPFLLTETWSAKMAIRYGEWKYLDHKGSGGNNYSRGMLLQYALPDEEPNAPGQLYNLVADTGEKHNIYNQYPIIVKELKSQIELYRTTGRSAPLLRPLITK
ncbi:MAG: arylsulfatase [Bacteroidales bacterium]|nr:arylsulfatase [Bacteroidales bacterium]